MADEHEPLYGVVVGGPTAYFASVMPSEWMPRHEAESLAAMIRRKLPRVVEVKIVEKK